MAKHKKPKPLNDLCFYCGVKMVRIKARAGLIHPPNMATCDHIIPQSRASASDCWSVINKALVCFRCNNAKGNIDPIEWLAIMPFFGVDALADRLKLLCYTHEQIETARRKRWQKYPNEKNS